MRVILATLLYLILIASQQICARNPDETPEATRPVASQAEVDLDPSDLDGLLLGDDTTDLDLGLPPAKPVPQDEPVTEKTGESPDTALPAEILELLETPQWIQETVLKAGLGYHENPLLTHLNEEPAPFVGIEAEFMAIRLPLSGRGQLYVYGFGEYRGYAKVPDLSREAVAIVQASYQRSLWELCQWETALRYAFNDRVFGLSPVEDELITTPLKLHQFFGKQGFSFNLPAQLKLQADVFVEQNLFVASTSDYWKPGVQLSLERSLFDRSLRVQAGGEFYLRYYDSRQARNSNGFAIPGTVAKWMAWEPFLAVRYKTTGEQPFSLYAKMAYRWNDDDAQGFDDSARASGILRLTQEWRQWEFELHAAVSHYHYPNQAVSRSDPRPRYLLQWFGGAAIERALTEDIAARLSWDTEINRSLRETETYSANQVFLSMEIAF